MLSLHKKLKNRDDANEFFGLPRGTSIDLKERKLQFYNDELINLENVNGPYERAQLYNYLNDRILNRREKRFVKVKLIGGVDNYHVSFELINYEESILYEEEKQNDRYVLIKK